MPRPNVTSPRTVYAFIDQDSCPICSRLLPKLRKLDIEGKIDLVEVPVRKMRGGRLMEKYKDICNNVFGGREEVPVVTVEGMKDHFIPARRTDPQGNPIGEGDIEEHLDKIVDLMLEAVEEPKPSFSPTHSYMLNSPLEGNLNV